MTLDELCARLLPSDEHLHFETLLLGDCGITLMATMTASKALCPDCHQFAHRIHSGYPRTLADLPWALMPVELVLHARRFFCDTSGCGRTTFTERYPPWRRYMPVPPHGWATAKRMWAWPTGGLPVPGS